MSQFTPDADNLLKTLGKQRGPAPVHLWDPPYCGEMDMRIAADGRWYHEGSPIGRLRMVQLFSSILRLDDDGHYYLVTPVEKVRIRVDDCPFVAQVLDVIEDDGQQVLRFTLNTEETVDAGPDHPLEVDVTDEGEPHPVIEVRRGLKALISRSVFYQLVELAARQADLEDEEKSNKNNESNQLLSISSRGKKFALGQF
ncbi:DUF1285 domain-containing protein [Pseudohongiella spirulinae]|uniref:Proteophosphoglycan n=1 Tax=Pseudohongiella spirulinae TaxID=1249552 RepID=A0A0S2KDT0_9GAMM|nr:DUF1285 domain-containing protein [Pseudohongiella spirulinae]ALO46476.1 hypothetical protein PS2015_1827 [Pseudohongiella spirulinae]